MTFWGRSRLMRNRGDGTFEDATQSGRPRDRAAAVGDRLRLPRLRPRRPARSLRRALHRLRPGDGAGPRVGPVPLQGSGRGLRSAGPARSEERALPQCRRRTVHRRLRGVGDHGVERHLQPRRQHPRLRRRRLGRPLRRQRLEPERALPQQPRRHLHRHRAAGRLRLQPGRPAAGRHGRRGRRLRSRRPRRHLQDELRRRHLDAVRQPAGRRPRAPPCATTAPTPAASAATRAGSGGASRSPTSISMRGPTCSWSTATSIRRSIASRPRPATGSRRSSTAIAATAASTTSASGWGRR